MNYKLTSSNLTNKVKTRLDALTAQVKIIYCKEQIQHRNLSPLKATRLAAGGELYRLTLTCQHLIFNAYLRHQKQHPNKPKPTTKKQPLTKPLPVTLLAKGGETYRLTLTCQLLIFNAETTTKNTQETC